MSRISAYRCERCGEITPHSRWCQNCGYSDDPAEYRAWHAHCSSTYTYPDDPMSCSSPPCRTTYWVAHYRTKKEALADRSRDEEPRFIKWEAPDAGGEGTP